MRSKFVVCTIVISLSLLLVACPPINTTPPTPSSTTPIELPTATVQASPTATLTPEQIPETSTPTVSEVKITVGGFGLAPKDELDPARRKRSAIRSAELDADKNLADWLAGVTITGEKVSVEGEITVDRIREIVEAKLRLRRNTIEENFDNTTGEAEIVVEYVAILTE